MRSRKSRYGAILATTLGAVLALMTSAAPSFAGLPTKGKSVQAPLGGGNVPPGMSQPKGYSLLRLAEETAAFNVTDRTGPPPALPFQMLYWRPRPTGATFEVRTGTMLYVPVIYNDDSEPVLGNFPDPTDRDALLFYWYDQSELGVVYANITVDGQTTSLGPDYLVGFISDTPLPDGATQYMTMGAVLSPLTKGQHKVVISGLATGAALDPFFLGGIFEFSNEYTVIVR
jgi:hypothetical protein